VCGKGTSPLDPAFAARARKCPTAVAAVSHPRRTELALLALALAVVTVAMALVGASKGWPVPPSTWTSCATFAALVLATHLAIRLLAPTADALILPCMVLINGLGLVMIHRLDLAYTDEAVRAGAQIPDEDAPRQLMWTGAALVTFVVVLYTLRDHRTLSRYTYLSGALGLLLLVLPGVLPSSISQVNGAKLWLRVGGLSVQPGEFSKILIIVCVAGLLVAKRALFLTAGRRVLGMEFPRARDLAPLLLAWLVSVGVVALERELGASLLFFGVVLAMIYIATERISWLVVGLVLFAGGSVLGYELFTHVQQRVVTWLDPLATYDQPGGGYQVTQALFGFATGGVLGSGLGGGRPDLVPFASTDFISGAVGEEMGLAGLAAILLLYLLVCVRGMRAALTVRDSFGKLLAGGLSFSMALQVFVVVGGVTGLIPLTGMTMPLLSYGGSSLLANHVLLAILVRVSAVARRERAAADPGRRKASLAQAATVFVPLAGDRDRR
jgi:cell division protein FtsW (lipid II flippase)